MSVSSFDIVAGYQLSGCTLIEASAGTGKTWTIGALFVRALIERDLDIGQILVLTFTEAATQELRERLRSRLQECRIEVEDLQAGREGDGLLRAMRDQAGPGFDLVRVERRLRQAVEQFDEASIFTIHSFCRRALAEYPLASGVPTGFDLLTQKDPLSQNLLLDQFRKLIYRQPASYLGWLEQRMGALLDWKTWRSLVETAFTHPDTKLAAASAIDEDLPALEAALAAARLEALPLLETPGQQEEVISLLVGGDLNATSYKEPKLRRLLPEALNWLASDDLAAPADDFALFTPRRMARAVKKNRTQPEHAFFVAFAAALEAFATLERQLYQRTRNLVSSAFTEWPPQIRERRVSLGRLRFDDLLSSLRSALHDERGKDLIQQLRDRWRLVLVDEFQDTDPVQADILDTVFRHETGSLLLVGDPKQAIYGFRGADVQAYLMQAGRVDRTYSLGTNYRSRPPLVEAVNQLFQAEPGEAGPGIFLNSRIAASPVRSADRADQPQLVLKGLPEAAMSVIHLVATGKGAALSSILADLTARVGQLLSLSASDLAGFEHDQQWKPLKGSDIAILVRKSAQGRAVSRAFGRAGIPHVLSGGESVWASEEAWQLELLLAAIGQPSRRSLTKSLFLSALFSSETEDPSRLEDEAVLAGWQQLVRTCARKWQQFGFVSALRDLFRETGLLKSLLGRAGGERSLTNLFHLIEILHEAAGGRFTTPPDLLRLLQELRSDDNRDPSRELRLESEEDLVRIITQHGSKGLEFPIVFAPFVWDSRAPRRSGMSLELLRDGDSAASFHLCMPDSPLDAADKRLLATEALGEDMRLCYVTLTRAVHRLVVHSVRIEKAPGPPSAFDWQLCGGEARGRINPADWRPGGKQDDQVPLGTRWQDFANSLPGRVAIEGLVEDATGDWLVPHAEPAECLTRLEVQDRLPARQGWMLSSFTSLVSHGDADTPDHDATSVTGPASGETGPDQQVAAPDEALAYAATFPRGARAGSCLHELLEVIDFSQADQPELWRDAAETQLERHGLPVVGVPELCAWLGQILRTPMAAGATPLSRLDPARQVRELAFHMSVPDVPATEIQHLFQASALFDADRLKVKSGAARGQLARVADLLGDGIPQGVMKGFIDLVYLDDGRWWILDWKSNHLGDHPDRYDREALCVEMARTGYLLQALIYGLALHRHLSLSLPGYDPELHLGGCRYVFLRGVAAGKPGTGVFEDRWPHGLVPALDKLLGHGGPS